MGKTEKGSSKLSTQQILTLVIVPILVVLLPLVFGDTPFSRALWGRVLSTSTEIPASLAPPTETAFFTLTPTAENTATPVPTALPTEAPTATIMPTALTCAWSSFLNGEDVTPLSGEKCLNDLVSYGISSENEKQISFYLGAWKKPGLYGVCQDVSARDEITFHLDLKDSLTAGRFLIALAAGPVPNQSSHALRLQYENSDLYLKAQDYSETGIDNGVSFIIANPLWKKLGGVWGFDFKLTITGAQLKGTVNGVNVLSTQLNSANRYLCFAYQANQGLQATQLDAKITFP